MIKFWESLSELTNGLRWWCGLGGGLKMFVAGLGDLEFIVNCLLMWIDKAYYMIHFRVRLKTYKVQKEMLMQYFNLTKTQFSYFST